MTIVWSAFGGKACETICEVQTLDELGNALANNGWEIGEDCISKAFGADCKYGGRSYKKGDRVNVGFESVCEARRMHYAEYKRSYPTCKTLNDYDSATKKITVLIPLVS